MKKILSTLLVGGALLVSLAACGGNGPDLGKEVSLQEFRAAWTTVTTEAMQTSKVGHIKAEVKTVDEFSMTDVPTEKEEDVYNIDRDVVNGDHFDPDLNQEETIALQVITTYNPDYAINHYSIPGCTTKFFFDETAKTFGFTADYETSGTSAGFEAKQVLHSKLKWDCGGFLIYGDEETVIEASGMGLKMKQSEKATVSSTITYVAL